MQPAPFLTLHEPKAAPGIISLNRTIRIGSAPESDLGSGDPTLAPEQAEIRVGAGRITFVPLGPGVTTLNDAAVNSPMLLARGDTIRVGGFQLHLTPRGIEYEDTAGRWIIEQRRPRALPEDLLARLKQERSAFMDRSGVGVSG